MAKTNNIYIKKARKKRMIKKIFIAIIFVIISVGIFITKTNTFKIDEIECAGESLVTKDYIVETSEQLKGKNIFFTTKHDVNEILKANPYVDNIEIVKEFPRKLVINVREKKGLYYINDGTNYNIISSELVFLEKLDSIEGRELIELKGIDTSDKKIGEKISDDTRVQKLLEEFYKEEEVIKNKAEEFSIVSIDLSDLSNIKLYLNDILVYLGRDENIREKMGKAINVYKSGVVTEYINASFKGTPDFK